MNNKEKDNIQDEAYETLDLSTTELTNKSLSYQMQHMKEHLIETIPQATVEQMQAKNIVNRPIKENEKEDDNISKPNKCENSMNNDDKKIPEICSDMRLEVQGLKNEVEKSNVRHENMSKLFTIVLAVIGLLATVLIFGVNAQFGALNTSINSKFEIINQKLDSQKEINQLQIQRDVSQEFLKQKK